MNTKRRDVSLRIPQDALDRIDQHAKDLRMTRTGYLILAGCQELDHVPIPDNELDEIHRRLEIRRDVHRLHPATEEVRNQSFPRTRHRLGAARVFRDVLAGQRPDPPRPAPTVALTVAAWGHHGSPYGQSREVTALLPDFGAWSTATDSAPTREERHPTHRWLPRSGRCYVA
jgi:hypothetical protein